MSERCALNLFLIGEVIIRGKVEGALTNTWTTGVFLDRIIVHASIPAWEMPLTEEPGRRQSMGLQESDMT